MPSARADFLIVTPLAEERDAVLDRLPGHRKLPPSDDDVRVYYQADLPVRFPDGSASRYTIIVVPLAKMGHTEAASAAGDAIRRWQPRYVILVGIAGGVAKAGVRLGDVLVSDQVADYELQKVEDGQATIRWHVHRVDQRLLIAAQNYSDRSWEKTTAARPGRRPPSPDIHFGPICTGNKVVADESLLSQFREVWAKLIGVEMEAGVANAASQAARAPGFFMIRGVSDLADAQKDSKRVKKWRAYACEIAAAFVIDFLKSGPVTAGNEADPSAIQVEDPPSVARPVGPVSTREPMAASDAQGGPGSGTFRRTMVELDLAGYSTVARELEENASVEVVATLNDQIQGFVDSGLAAVGVPRERAVMATTGDGAILAFKRPEEAHRFARAVHEAARDHNATKTVASAKRAFRVGAATGEVHFETRDGRRSMAGTTIANAVRLEAAAKVGEVLIDAATYEELPADLRHQYGPRETVKGKREEVFDAYRCVVVPGAAGTPAEPTVGGVLDLFDQLNPRDQLSQLMTRVGMPTNHRPANTLPLADREAAVVDWAAGSKDLLKRLDSGLRSLIEKQGRPHP